MACVPDGHPLSVPMVTCAASVPPPSAPSTVAWPPLGVNGMPLMQYRLGPFVTVSVFRAVEPTFFELPISRPPVLCTCANATGCPLVAFLAFVAFVAWAALVAFRALVAFWADGTLPSLATLICLPVRVLSLNRLPESDRLLMIESPLNGPNWAAALPASAM